MTTHVARWTRLAAEDRDVAPWFARCDCGPWSALELDEDKVLGAIVKHAVATGIPCGPRPDRMRDHLTDALYHNGEYVHPTSFDTEHRTVEWDDENESWGRYR